MDDHQFWIIVNEIKARLDALEGGNVEPGAPGKPDAPEGGGKSDDDDDSRDV